MNRQPERLLLLVAEDKLNYFNSSLLDSELRIGKNRYMKRFLVILFLLLSTLTFSACGQPAFQPSPDGYYTGTIEKQGIYWVFTAEQGTFKIRSTFLDLNPYIGKKIRIHGQFSKDTFFIDDVKAAQ